MIVELLEDGPISSPLVRIYRWSGDELNRFHNSLGELSVNSIEKVLLSQTDFLLNNIQECELTNVGDSGVAIAGSDYIEWSMAADKWALAANLVEGFIDGPTDENTYQWLAGPMAVTGLNVGRVSVLLSASKDGLW